MAGVGSAAGLLAPTASAEPVDPIVCPILASTSPGVPGVVDVTAEGDVYVLGDAFWNCPPYTD